jgi:four helix bundle protein
MKEDNIIKNKSYDFGLKIIKTYQDLKQDRREFIISKQLVRSGTSIGANVEEAIGAQSKSDFISKVSISYKEARETLYWLHILTDSGFLNKQQSNPLISDCEELLKILGSIIKTSKLNS